MRRVGSSAGTAVARTTTTRARRYDDATAAVFGAGGREASALDDAIAAKKSAIADLAAQTEALKKEQERILADARAKANAPAEANAPPAEANAPPAKGPPPAPAAPFAPPPAAEPAPPAAARTPSFAETAETKPSYEERREARRRARAGGGAGKKRYLRLTNPMAGCALVVRADDGGSGDPQDESAWVRCDRYNRNGAEAVFEATPGDGPGRVRLRSLKNGKFVEMVPPSNKLGWVVRATNDAPSAAADFEMVEHRYVRATAAGGLITVIVDGSPKDSNPIRGHGNKPHNAGPGVKEPRSEWTSEWLDEGQVVAAKAASADAAAGQKRLETDLGQDVLALNATGTGKRVVAYGLYGSSPKYCVGAIRNSELVKTYFPGWIARFYHREDVPESYLSQLRTNGAELVLMKKGSAETTGETPRAGTPRCLLPRMLSSARALEHLSAKHFEFLEHLSGEKPGSPAQATSRACSGASSSRTTRTSSGLSCATRTAASTPGRRTRSRSGSRRARRSTRSGTIRTTTGR